LQGGVLYWNWVVEHHHHPVTSISFSSLKWSILNRLGGQIGSRSA
jgi:hypothetical protein